MSDHIVLDTPDQIQMYMLLAAKGRLKLEVKGMRFKGQSVKAQVDKFLGRNDPELKDKPYPRTKQDTLTNLESYLQRVHEALTEDPA